MAEPFGAASTMVPAAASKFGIPQGDKGGTKRNAEFDNDEEIDPRVKWANAKDAQLKDEANDVRAEQRRAMDYYLGRQTFVLNRPRWMHRVIDNMSFWVVDRWSALLTDNKPKVSFAALKPEDQEEADIANAAFQDDYIRQAYQAKMENAVTLSRIEKKGYIRQIYDPLADQGRGAIIRIPVSGTQIYVNAEATCLDDATLLMYEYVEPTSKVLGRWKKLEGKLRDQVSKEKGEPYKRVMSPSGSTTGFSEGSAVPGGAPGDSSGATSANSPYSAKASPPNQAKASGTKVREFWMLHPTKKTKVKKLVWTLGGEPATEPKMIQFYDSDGNPTNKEPLMTVVTEGNVVYEWPLSTAILTEHIGQHFGGLKVLKMRETRKVVTEKSEVPLYPGGRRMILAENHIASDGMNPFVDGHWPFAEIDAHSDGKNFYGKGDIDIIWPLQDAYNRLISQLMDAAHMTANPIWRLPFGRKTPNEMITNAPGAIIDEDLPSLRYGKREKGPEMPAYLMQLLQWLVGRVEKLTGLTELAQGGKSKGNQAAETVSMYQDAASLPARAGIRSVERCEVKLGYQWLSLASQFYSEPRWVQIKDSIGEDKTKMFIGVHLTAPMSIQAKAGSAMPQSPSARLAFMTQLMQSPYGTMEMWFESLEEVGAIDSASAAIKNIYKHADEFAKSRSEAHPQGDPIKLIGMPGMLALLAGGGQKKAAQNAGRSSRNRTPRING